MKNIRKWLTIVLVACILATFAVLIPLPTITIDGSGISFTDTPGNQSHAVILSDVRAYGRVEVTGTQLYQGVIYVRYDLYLDATAPYYANYYINKQPVYDNAGKVINTVTYNTPYLCVFMAIPANADSTLIKNAALEILRLSYTTLTVTGSPVQASANIRNYLTTLKLNAIASDKTNNTSTTAKNNKISTITANTSDYVANPNPTVIIVPPAATVAAATIDIGGAATDRSTYLAANDSYICGTNKADGTGTIDTIQLYAVTGYDLAGCKTGTFSYSFVDNFNMNATSRDYETIGNVTSGSAQTFTGLTCNVSTDDFIGIYFTSGRLEATATGAGGIFTHADDPFTGAAEAFNAVYDDGSNTIGVMSCYGTGTTSSVSAPTNVSATDGAHTDKVVVTWTQSAGANAYKVLRGATNASGTLGDVATYDDTGADAPTITAGNAVATDGTFTDKIYVNLSGSSANNGTTHSYTVYASSDGGTNWSVASSADNGFRGVGALTYQWQKSASTTDDTYSNIGGATSSTYDDSAAPAGSFTNAGTITATDGTSNVHVVLESTGVTTTNGAVRWYKCTLNATGATQQVSASNDGYRSVGGYTYQWQRSAGDSDAAYSDIVGATTTPYNDTGAPAGVITPGTATASDGTSSAHVTLTLAGQSSVAGAGRYYKLILSAAGAADVSPAVNRGYRSIGALTYQWQRSAADADAAYGNIAGATTNPYNDTAAPAGTIAVTTELFRGFGLDWIILEGTTATGTAPEGRWYLCVVSASGATPANSTHDRGIKSATAITQYGFDYGLTTAYGSAAVTTAGLTIGESFVDTIRGLTAGTVYHFRAKAFAGAWSYGADLYVCTKGSPVIYEFYNINNDGDSAAIYGSEFTAQQFTAQTTSHTAIYIKLYIKRVGAAPGDVLVELKHANVAHEPTGNAIASGTLDGDTFSTSYLWLTFVLDEVNIVGGSEYAIVVSAPTGGVANYVMIAKDAGGGLVDAVGMHSHDGGSTWTSDTPTDYLFEVWGNPCISVVKALAYPNYIVTGDILFALEYINEYPPYVDEPQEDVREYFTIRLLDIDGLTVIASTPMVQWGNMPGSIYLNATQAASITHGGAYYLEIYGIFTGNPSSSYQLVAKDWNGSINGWVLNTAHDMELYYTTTTSTVRFTVFLAKVNGEVLTSDANNGGGTIFNLGIPYLMQTHPELFQVLVTSPTYTPPTSAVAPLTGNWQVQVGAGISGLFNSVGTMFGINGKYIGSAILMLLYLGMVISVGAKGGTPIIALAIAFPVIGFGVWAFLVDYVIVAVVILILAALALIGYWVTRT